ncbi:MAG: lytic transglycosylase domain-containing protein [Bacteroidetes bacterium]|nr:lytic transglycosylase domain-containing protein [Bacteroidota bacterium]
MVMWYKYFLFIFFFIIILRGTPSYSRQIQNSFTISSQRDTLISDTLKNRPPANDLKAGFKDLFVTPVLANGVSAAQLNPMAISFVQDYMKKYGKGIEKMKGWGKPYFDLIDGILTQHGIPKEMKYLAVIESSLKSNEISWAGAVGPWQFMPSTARRMGLHVNSSMDERTDYYKSTHAAARYLTELYSIYGDWLLVIAAYNGGPGNVNRAIKKSGSKNFWDLQYYLPEESRNHVKKFIATHYIMEGQGGVTTVTKDEAKEILFAKADATANLTPEELKNSKTQLISGKYNSMVIVKNIGMDLITFSRMNPDFDKRITTNGNYELRLPSDKIELFNSRRNQILDESVQLLINSATSSGTSSNK